MNFEGGRFMSVKTAVILAAGMGSRLQDITKNEVPKGQIGRAHV